MPQTVATKIFATKVKTLPSAWTKPNYKGLLKSNFNAFIHEIQKLSEDIATYIKPSLERYFITHSKQATNTIIHFTAYSTTLELIPFFFIFSTSLATYVNINWISQIIANIKLPRAILPKWYLKAQ